MSVEYYSGIEGACIKVENVKDLQEAIDTIHTQVMDNIGEDSELLKIVSRWLDEAYSMNEDGTIPQLKPIDAERKMITTKQMTAKRLSAIKGV